MNSDYYVNGVLTAHQPIYTLNHALSYRNTLLPTLQSWAGNNLISVDVSGSLAKGTGISGTTDIDLLVSLRHNTPHSVQDISNNLLAWLRDAGFTVSRRNVAVSIEGANGLKIDVVPARKQNAWTNDHWLWSHRTSGNRQTNVREHITYVTNSGRINEIRALKIWRKQHNLDFPSFLLEMSAITALRGRLQGSVSANFVQCLTYIQDELPNARLVDPANTNNIVSNDLSATEKQALSRAARLSLGQNWQQVIW